MIESAAIRQVRKMVSETCGEPGAAYIQRIVSSMRNMRAHVLEPTDAVRRWMKRAGVRSSGYGEWVAEASHTGGLSNLEVCLALRLFAEKIPGLKNQPVCGETPSCGDCLLKDRCPFYLGAGKAVADPKLTGEKLASGANVPVTPDALAALLLFGNKPSARQNNSLKSLLTETSADVAELFRVSAAELKTRHGFTTNEARRLLATRRLFELWRDAGRNFAVRFKDARDFFDLYHLRLRDLKKEQFWVVLLNQQNQFIGEEMVSEGTLTETLIHPREVFGPALRAGAAAVAFLHNHPSGNPAPSPIDHDITHRLMEAARILGIRVIDHVVIAPGSFYSFAEFGKLE